MQLNLLFEKKLIGIPLIVWIFFVAGLILRLMPIRYGLPLILNIDEPSVVSATSSLRYDPNPNRFDWPHLFFYINFIFYGAGYFFEKIVTLPADYQDRSLFLMISRALTAIFGALTILSVYKISMEASKKVNVATLASLIFAILPMHVHESYIAKPDVPMVFFASVATLFILKSYHNPLFKNYTLSGIFIGLAMSTKYNAFLLFLPFFIVTIYNVLEKIIFHLRANCCCGYSNKEKTNIEKKLEDKDSYCSSSLDNNCTCRENTPPEFSVKGIFMSMQFKYIPFLITSGFVSIIFFLIGTPYALLDFKTFWSYQPQIGVLWQFSNVGNVEWVYYPAQIYETFANMYRSDLGFTIWVIFILMIIQYLFFNRRTPIYNILLLSVIIISVYISKLDRSPSHYFLFLSVMYVPLIAEYVIGGFERISPLLKSKSLRLINFSILLLVLLMPSFYESIKETYAYSQTDPRLASYKWFKQNIKENEFHVYTYGEAMTNVVFQEKRADRVKRVDKDDLSEIAPFILVIGEYGATPEMLKENNYRTKLIRGDYRLILDDAELLFYADNINKAGTPVMIYKVNNVE